MASHTVILRDGHGDSRTAVSGDGVVRVDGGPPITATLRPDGAIRIGEAPARTVWAVATGDIRWVFLDGEVYRFEVERRGQRPRATGHHGSLMAPMPATVLEVSVASGDMVQAGDTLILLEAMKMELPVRAPVSGRVTAVHCRKGELVQPGVALIDIEPTGGS
jgi:acetyl/propionyl-CoA carboxylase alpha subunit